MADQKEKNFTKATIILESAVEFLAAKHNTTTAEVWAAVMAKHEKMCNQLIDVVLWGIEEVQSNKA